MSKLTDALVSARDDAHKRVSQIDTWLRENEDKRSELIDALLWYADNRTHRFGWRSFYDTLREQPGWDTLPGNYQCLLPWVKANLPDAF